MVLRFLGLPEPGDETACLDALEQVGHGTHPSPRFPALGGDGKRSAAFKRAQALWFKRTRADLDRRCRSLMIQRSGFEEGASTCSVDSGLSHRDRPGRG